MSALHWATTDRYYRVSIQKDLLGELSVLCVWGSRHSKRGNHKLIPCGDLASVRRTVRLISKVRRRHGYGFRQAKKTEGLRRQSAAILQFLKSYLKYP